MIRPPEFSSPRPLVVPRPKEASPAENKQDAHRWKKEGFKRPHRIPQADRCRSHTQPITSTRIDSTLSTSHHQSIDAIVGKWPDPLRFCGPSARRALNGSVWM